MDFLCFVLSCVCYVYVSICLYVFCALWSPAGKGLTSWLSFVVSNCHFVTFPIGVLGQVWYLIVSIPDHGIRPSSRGLHTPYITAPLLTFIGNSHPTDRWFVCDMTSFQNATQVVVFVFVFFKY